MSNSKYALKVGQNTVIIKQYDISSFIHFILCTTLNIFEGNFKMFFDGEEKQEKWKWDVADFTVVV